MITEIPELIFKRNKKKKTITNSFDLGKNKQISYFVILIFV